MTCFVVGLISFLAGGASVGYLSYKFGKKAGAELSALEAGVKAVQQAAK